MTKYRAPVRALLVVIAVGLVVTSAPTAALEGDVLHRADGPDDAAGTTAVAYATQDGTVELSSRDEGRELAAVWAGGFTITTGEGSLLLEWACERGEFHAVEYIDEGSTVTRGGTRDSNGTRPAEVSHVGRLADSTTSTVRPSAQWVISSDHDGQDPPGDCTAVIAAVEGTPVLEPPRVDDPGGSTVVHRGERQVAAESRLEDGHAATYRVTSDGRDRSRVAVAVGTIHLDLGNGGTTVQAPDDRGAVTTTVVRDMEVVEQTEAPLDESIWHPAITAFSRPTIASILRENPTLISESSGPDMVVSALADSRFNVEWGDDGRVGVVTANDGTVQRVDPDGVTDSDYEIEMSQATADDISGSQQPLHTAVSAYRNGDIAVRPGSGTTGFGRLIAQVKLTVGELVFDLLAG